MINNFLYSVQALRGIAALLVLLFHAKFYTEKYVDSSLFGNFFYFGHAGVELFFVLSGFIIYNVHKMDIGKREKAYIFMKKRFLRIYPTFLFVHIFLLIIYTVMMDKKSLEHFFFGIAFLPYNDTFYLSVAWSITYEVIFYLLFFLFIVFKKKIAFITGSFILFMLMIQEYYSLSFHYFLMFALGIIAAFYANKYEKISTNKFLFILGIIVFIISAYYDTGRGQNFFGMGYAFSAFLFLVSYKSFEIFFKKEKVMNFLGKSSYSIYLIHTIFLSLSAKIAAALIAPTFWNPNLFFIVISLMALIGSIFFYYLFEYRQNNLFNNLWSKK